MMLEFLNIVFMLTHIAVILFNLFGWIWKKTRKLHLWLVGFTLASWLLLGIKYGLGYCFLTDWHWSIKRQLGAHNLPNSFVHYVLEKIGISMESSTTDIITVVAFILAIGMSLYLNFFKVRKESIN